MIFLLGALLLSLLAALFVLLPLWRAGSAETSRRAALAAVAKDRLAELERDHTAGTVDAVAFEQLRHEAERRFLNDATMLASDAATPTPTRRGKRLALVLPALLLPLAALLLHAQLGGLPDWQLQSLLEQAQQQRSAEHDNREVLEALRQALTQRLERVEDADGRRRVILARLELETGNLDAAVEQYRTLYRQFPDDPDAAAQLAQALYLANGRRMTPEVDGLARAAVAMAPGQTTALGLLGIGAFEQGDYSSAISHWQRLVSELPPQSVERQVIARGIAEARRRGGELPAGPALEVTVTLAPALASSLTPDAVLFVFAREAGGAPMPLAAARLQPDEWPVKVRLDESNAMAAGVSLAAVSQVDVIARISQSGQPQPSAGDLEGAVAGIDLGSAPVPVALTIDRQL